MKHVAILKSSAQQKGGLEKAASRIADAFLAKGMKVTLLTTGETSAANVVSFKTVGWPSFVRMEQFDSRVQEWIKNEKPNLVFGMDRNRFQTHVRAGNGVHLAYLKSRILTEGKWKYLSCLLNPMHRKILEIEKTAFEHPKLEKIIANSHMVKNQLLESYNVDEKKIAVIHNGVEWHEMSPAFSNRKSGNAFHFLFIGNGYLRKGLKVLLEALAQIKGDFQLSVIGKDNHIQWFKNYSRSLGIQNKVHFLGPVENIIPFYQTADALVIPSFYDPFANVTVEALAMGLSVVSSKHNGGHEILTKENGFVIENLTQIESVVAALQSCMNRTHSASQIRESVKYLDYANQMRELMRVCEK